MTNACKRILKIKLGVSNQNVLLSNVVGNMFGYGFYSWMTNEFSIY